MKTLSCLSYPENLMLALVYITQMLQEAIIKPDIPRIATEKYNHKSLGSGGNGGIFCQIIMDF